VRFCVSPPTLSVASFGFFAIKLLTRHVLHKEIFFFTRELWACLSCISSAYET
jgi:hypothetical protein